MADQDPQSDDPAELEKFAGASIRANSSSVVCSAVKRYAKEFIVAKEFIIRRAIMKRTITIFAAGLAWAIAMSGACAAAENNAQRHSSAGSPIVVAQAKPTDADKKKLSDEIQQRYKPGPGKSTAPSGTTPMASGTASSCGGTGQIAACSAACSASCIFSCFPPNTPWGSGCHSCVNTCMDKCTGCGTGTSN
jgi:hypothetical protein